MISSADLHVWQQPWFAVTGWVFGLMGVLFGLLTWWAWKHPRAIQLRLAWSLSDEIVYKSDSDPNVELRVDGKLVPRLSRSVVTLVNTGPGSIRSADLTETSETPAGTLLLKFPEGTRPLRAQLSGEEPSHTLAAVEISGDQVQLRFGLMERNDVLQLAVLHDGADFQNAVLVGHIANGEIGSYSPQTQKAYLLDAVVEAASSAVPGASLSRLITAALFGR